MNKEPKTYKELLKITKDMDLESQGFFLGKEGFGYNTVSCWGKDGTWFFKQVFDVCDHIPKEGVKPMSGTEEEIINRMYCIMYMAGIFGEWE